MAAKPYPVFRLVRQAQGMEGGKMWWDVEIELADTPNTSARKERLLIETRIDAPLPRHLPTLELAALHRVQELLNAQIEVMRSP